MLTALLAFIVALAVLVVFHEFGHYLVARACGVRIERFSVGFGRVLARRVDRHGTEWALSALPLGGYVKMLDEAPANADAATRAQALGSQALWRRALIVLAGPLANFLLAALIYAALAMWGSLQTVALLDAPVAHTPAAAAQVTAGARIEAVDGRAVQSWEQVLARLLEPLALHQPVTLGLRLEDDTVRDVTLDWPGRHAPDGQGAVDPLAQLGLVPWPGRPVVHAVTAGGPGAQAGLRAGDRIEAVDDLAQPTVAQVVQAIQAHAGEAVTLRVQRDGVDHTLRVVPHAVARTDGGQEGRMEVLIDGVRPQVLVRTGVLGGLTEGARQTFDMGAFSVRMLARMVRGEASWRNLSGPVTIAEYAGQSARVGAQAYLRFLALVSISLGVLNLLPIPPLDGGHLLFHALEAVRGGRPVPAHWRERGLAIGLALVLALTVLAFYNDLARLLS